MAIFIDFKELLSDNIALVFSVQSSGRMRDITVSCRGCTAFYLLWLQLCNQSVGKVPRWSKVAGAPMTNDSVNNRQTDAPMDRC